MRLHTAPLLLITALTAAAQQPAPVSASAQFQAIQSRLRASHAASDWLANLAAAQDQQALLNDDPAALLEVARAEVHIRDVHLNGDVAAIRELQQFVRMGQSTDFIEKTPDFATLRNRPEYADLQRDMAANRAPIALAATALVLPDANLLAEDIDVDTARHRFLITSVREHKIVAVSVTNSASGPAAITDFAPAPDPWPIVAIKIDRTRSRVWATESAMQGLSFSPKSDWGRTAVLCYDLRSGKLLRRVEGPHGSAFGDMLLLPNGDVIVSDGDGGGLYRLASNPASPDHLDRIDHGEFISPQTPALAPDGHRLFVPDYERGLAILDLTTQKVSWLAPQGRFALNGIDGLYCNRNQLIAVQNGTSPERVILFTLDAPLATIVSEKIIERATPTLGDPTHGVLIGRDFYYIANSGWDILDAHGNINSGAKPSQPRIMRATVPGPQPSTGSSPRQ